MGYKLSAILDGHSADVRGLVAYGSDTLVSVSRDGTGRIWKRKAANGYEEDSVLLGHEGYISSVTWVPATSKHPQGLIATGGMDKTICLWDPANVSQPVCRLQGHTDNVCALAASADGQVLVSGSWDKTARVWVDGKCVYTLKDHQYAVWGVLVLPDGSIVTGSADKQIRIWRNGSLVNTISGHSDCVRALAQTACDTFASASNDGTIRLWDKAECKAELIGHTSLVYALKTMPDSGLVSGGEDRSMRVWKNSELKHTILVPSISVWAVAALDNGDIACGTNDGCVYIFTKDPTRVATSGMLEAFARQNASFAVSAKSIGVTGQSKLLGPERLQRPGDSDEQVIVIKDGSTVSLHQWSQEYNRWDQMGLVTDAAGQTKKQVFEGKEYDYVFDVDIQEGAPPLKLPFNASENPYTAAQRFLERHELSMEHLDTVANFIIKNADGVQLGTQKTDSFADPFTGGNRYVPAQSQGAASSGSYDPFTGGNRYVPAASSTSTSYVPPTEFVINSQGNPTAIIKKLAEFNSLLTQDSSTASLAINDEDMQRIRELESLSSSFNVVSETVYGKLLECVLAWPADKRFPGLDLLRLVVVFSTTPFTYITNDNKDLVACINEASRLPILFASDHPTLAKSDEINAMMGVRALANAFASEAGKEMIWNWRKQILKTIDGSWTLATNKNLVTAISNLYLNLAIAATQKNDDDQGLDILSAASRFLNNTNNADAQLRLLNVFGVLATKFQLCKDSARVLGDETVVILGITGQTDAIKQTAQQVGNFLSA
ncbi:WD repeat protein Lub1 [Coemansia brasiliensis]|uniref:WD repeat protein Lub1 n=1 Tax=Coemansia brasiliensis TaxID=2650707 RepID=A0A9W8IF50_9FUNG|nr:WD repeat protein Lub1 [Coemansia brasiliensis]